MNLKERDISIIKHIREYCDQIRMTVEHFGNDFTIFDNDAVYRNAISLCILQIGELVAAITDEFKSAHNEIPWKQIKQMRNIVVHRYGTVDSTIVWDVIQNDIPNLEKFCVSEERVP